MLKIVFKDYKEEIYKKFHSKFCLFKKKDKNKDKQTLKNYENKTAQELKNYLKDNDKYTKKNIKLLLKRCKQVIDGMNESILPKSDSFIVYLFASIIFFILATITNNMTKEYALKYAVIILITAIFIYLVIILIHITVNCTRHLHIYQKLYEDLEELELEFEE